MFSNVQTLTSVRLCGMVNWHGSGRVTGRDQLPQDFISAGACVATGETSFKVTVSNFWTGQGTEADVIQVDLIMKVVDANIHLKY